jgi:hypothetical protein
MTFIFIFIYYMVTSGYAAAVAEREPSRFHWVAICSGVLLPFILGMALAEILPRFISAAKPTVKK